MAEHAVSSLNSTNHIDPTHPLILQRADPWMLRHSDGYYYFTASSPEYDRIEIRRSWTVSGMAMAAPQTIWRKHSQGPMSWHIWAPELHWIDGCWYIYFAAGMAEDIWHIRTWVLSNPEADPFQGTWKEEGQLITEWDSFTLDGTSFSTGKDRYFVWAQKSREKTENSSLYIARMESGTKLRLPQTLLSKPELDWECLGYKVNEGPAALIRNGKVFITYSASATDHNYCMGLLSADLDSDLLAAGSWTKSSKPVLVTDASRGIYGPGHNSFVPSEDGSKDILVYHARPYRDVSAPLFDPNRHTWVKEIRWDQKGFPVFRD